MSGITENDQDVIPKISKNEVNTIIQKKSGINLQKTEIDLKIGQDIKRVHNEKEESVLATVAKEKNEKNALKPNHLYVRNTKEMETILLRRSQKRDQEKRLKIFREKNSVQREL